MTTLWRDWLTAQIVEQLELTQRQQEVVLQVRTSGRFTNKDYQEAFDVSKPTATRDLEALRQKGVLVKVGRTGKGTHYLLNPKGLTMGSMGSKKSKGSQRAHAQREMRRRKHSGKNRVKGKR